MSEGSPPRENQQVEEAAMEEAPQPAEPAGKAVEESTAAPDASAPADAAEPAAAAGGDDVPAAKSDHLEEKGKPERAERERKSDRSDRERGVDKDRSDREKERDRRDRREEKSSRRSRSRSRSRDRKSKSSRRSRSRDRDSRSKRRSRSRSNSRERRRGRGRGSRSRSRDRKKTSSRRSRSRERRRSRSRSRDHRRRSRDRRRSPSSGSDVGGYEPRRRQVAPAPITGPGTGADPYAVLRQQAVPHDPAAAMRLWQEQQLKAREMILRQQAQSAATATSKTQREVYVGNLVPGMVTADALRQLFNSALAVQFAGTLLPGMDPVINVNLHPEGKYSFVEFRTPDMATAALQLNGQVQLLGSSISVARPSGYVDPSKALTSAQAAEAALKAFQRGDMQALQAASAAGANLQGLGLPENIVNPAAVAPAPPVNVEGLSTAPTTCLCLTGMVTADFLKEDEKYEALKEDLREECEEIVPGAIADLKVPRPYDPALSDQYIGIANYGKVFARFNDPTSAGICKDKIHGRMFAGSLVQVYFVSEEAYAKA